MSTSKAALPDAGKKRARYTSVACNECKRRKIKCNGEKPCERCGNQSLECVYASNEFQDTDEYRRMASQIDTLEAQVKGLYDIVEELRQEIQTLKGSAGSDLHVVSSATGMGRGAAGMDVDMSTGGRLTFVAPEEDAAAQHEDPLLSLDRQEIIRLFSLYTAHIHPVFAIIHTEDVIWKYDKLVAFRDVARSRGMSSLLPPTDINIDDDLSIVVKMMMAVSSQAEGPVESQLSLLLYSDVQNIYKRRGYPPMQRNSADDDDEGEEERLANHQSWLNNCQRMRLLQALWHFQHNHEMQALAEIADARRAWETQGEACVPAGILHDNWVRLGEVTFAMYWMFTIMLKPLPRMDFSLDKGPAINFVEDIKKDEEETLAGALYEFAKISLTITFAFETPEEAHGPLELAVPPWSKDEAINFVHRWQTHFGDGFRSLSTVRLGSLSSKTPKQRIVQSIVYLLANYLRLMICRYKSGSENDGRYDGPIDEYYGSARHAQDSILVLWNVHQTLTTWQAQATFYNRFLLQATEWLYELINNRTVMLTPEIKLALERTLVMLEAYTPNWQKAAYVLQKLQESRSAGVLGVPIC